MTTKEVIVRTSRGDFNVKADVRMGLAITPDFHSLNNESSFREWEVTHVNTGYKINSYCFRTKKKASIFRNYLLTLGDWSKWETAKDIPRNVRKEAAKIKAEYEDYN